MAVAYDAIGNAPGAVANASKTTPFTWTHTPAGTPTAVYVFAGFSANTAFSAATVACTYGGTTMPLLKGSDSGGTGTDGFVVMFHLVSPASGAQTVSLTWSGVTLNGGGKGVTAASVTVTGSTTDGGATSGASSGNATSGSLAVSSTATGNLCLCAVVDGSGGLSWTAGTQRYSGPAGGDSSTGAGYDWGATLASAAGTSTFTWTQTSDFYGAVAVEAQAGGAAPLHLPVIRPPYPPQPAPGLIPPQVITGPAAAAPGTGNAGLAAGTGTALQPVAAITASAGLPAGAGTAQPPVPAVTVLAGLAAGTGTALQPSAVTSVTAGIAAIQASFTAVRVQVQIPPQVITAPAQAPATTASAGLATGTGAAQPPVPAITADAGLASGTGTAQGPVQVVTASAGLAAATGTAQSPVPAAGANAGAAGATGTSQQPVAAITVNAGLATGAAAAQQPVIPSGTYRLMDGVAGRPGVGSSGTQPPSSPASYSGSYMAGLIFQLTGTAWMTGYYWWVPPGGDTGPVKCALWQQARAAANQAMLVPGSVVTSGTLTAGQWNFIALSTPLLLAWPVTNYLAAVGFTTTIGFPDTYHQFGSGDPYASGITNGPLTAPGSDTALGGLWPQQPYTTASADPAVTFPLTNNLDDLLWLDVQVTGTEPAGASYRLWPNRPYSLGDGTNNGVSVDTDGYTMAVQFSLSRLCVLDKLWFYSATTAFSGAAAVALPARCAIWDVSSQTVVSGTDNASVSWKKPDGTAGAAGDGWLYCDYSSAGVTLSAGQDYKAAVWYAGGSEWRTALNPYWASPADGASGVTSGPLTAPNTAGSTPGQNSWHGPNLAWAYPGSYSNPENDWVDVEVTPGIAADAGLAAATGTAPQPGTETDASAGLASGTGTAQPPAPAVIVAAGLAAGIGAALQPAVSTPGNTTANAGLASASGAALQPVAGVQPAASLAAGTGTGQPPVPAVGTSPAAAIASGSAPQVITSVTVTAGLATAAGSAPQPVAVVQVTLGPAAGTGAAQQPGITITVIAGLASGTGTAWQPAAGGGTTTAPAGLASGTGTAWQATVPGFTGTVEWLVTPGPPRWHVTPAPPRWKVTLMSFGPIAAISLEYLNMLWTADLAGTELDPTGQTAGQPQLPVLFAVPQSSGNPLEPAEPATWYTAVWLTGTNIRGYVAQGLVGPSPALVQFTAGLQYDVWGQIQGTPEIPKRFCGTVSAY